MNKGLLSKVGRLLAAVSALVFLHLGGVANAQDQARVTLRMDNATLGEHKCGESAAHGCP